MRRLLPIAAVFIVVFIACNAKADGIDENTLVELLPTVDDIPTPPWFTNEFHDIYGNHTSGYEDWSQTTYASFTGWKMTHGRVNSTTSSDYYYYYDQEIRIGVSIRVSDHTWYSSKYGRNVTATESSFLFDKEWYSVGNGTTEFGYKSYEIDDTHFISYRDAQEAVVGFKPYGIDCTAGYFSKIGVYGVYIELNGLLYTSFDWLNWEREYLIPPESLMADDTTCLQFLKNYFDNYTRDVFNELEDILASMKPPSNLSITLEYYFDITDGKPLITTWNDYVVNCGLKKYYLEYNMTVEHLATGKKEVITGFKDGKISMDKVFNVSLVNSTGDGRFRITLDVLTDDTEYIDRVKDDSFLPNKAVIEYNVEISSRGNTRKVMITKARHCWIKVGNKWEILWSKKGYKQKDGTDGFEIRLRSVLAWEKRIKYYIYKFLQESNFYSNVKDSYKFDLAMIDSIPIYYERGGTPGYDPSLNIINMSNPAGSIYTYDSDEFDSIFHEYGHAIKEHAYHFADENVDDYLGGAHGGTCSETNIYFAFEEAHSEFFASLMVDYVKEKEFIEEQFLAPTDYYDAPCHFGKEGDKIEGAVAGLLLNGLYLNYVKKKYDDPQTKTYEIFAKACELCNKYLKHYPYSIHDVIPFIVAIEPECRDDLGEVDLLWNRGYGCGVWEHGNLYIDKIEGLYGYPLLIAVESSWFTSVEVNVNNTPYTVEEPDYGATDVSDGMACCIFIEKNTRIEADFSQGDGVYMILFNLNGDPMEEILAMYKWIGKAIIEIEKDGIKVVQGSVIVKSNAGTTYKAGDKIKITPHSEFVLSVENETALVYVMNGSVGVDNGMSYEEVEKNKKAVVTEESIDVSSYKDKELDDIWDNFGEAMETLGIEKEEGNGGRQPGFEIVAIAIALIFVTVIMRRRDKT